jgi:hypothetical protein
MFPFNCDMDLFLWTYMIPLLSHVTYLRGLHSGSHISFALAVTPVLTLLYNVYFFLLLYHAF